MNIGINKHRHILESVIKINEESGPDSSESEIKALATRCLNKATFHEIESVKLSNRTIKLFRENTFVFIKRKVLLLYRYLFSTENTDFNTEQETGDRYHILSQDWIGRCIYAKSDDIFVQQTNVRWNTLLANATRADNEFKEIETLSEFIKENQTNKLVDTKKFISQAIGRMNNARLIALMKTLGVSYKQVILDNLLSRMDEKDFLIDAHHARIDTKRSPDGDRSSLKGLPTELDMIKTLFKSTQESTKDNERFDTKYMDILTSVFTPIFSYTDSYYKPGKKNILEAAIKEGTGELIDIYRNMYGNIDVLIGSDRCKKAFNECMQKEISLDKRLSVIKAIKDEANIFLDEATKSRLITEMREKNRPEDEINRIFGSQ
ncbi:hypothetical protein N9N03_00435 [Chlamydiia bacterium]|nr:hypothetical protein [Chlamydiia bacterium]